MAKKNAVLVAFGKRVRGLREKKKLTREEFADAIGMDVSFLAHVELGNKNISLLRIADIAEGLGVEIRELFKAR